MPLESEKVSKESRTWSEMSDDPDIKYERSRFLSNTLNTVLNLLAART